jgi:hypothetical protein
MGFGLAHAMQIEPGLNIYASGPDFAGFPDIKIGQ